MDTFINQHPTSRHVLFIFCLVVKQPSQDASDECRWKVFQSGTLIAVDIIRTFFTARFQNCGYIKTLAIFCNVSQCCNFHHLSPSNTFPKYFADTAKHYFKSMDFIAFWTILFSKQSLILIQSLLHQWSVPGPSPTININKFSPVVTLRLALTHCCDLSRG